MDAFDADVLIYTARGDDLGASARRAVDGCAERIGSLVLLPEVLSKSVREGMGSEYAHLADVLATIDLKPVDREVAEAAMAFGAKYRLRAADAIHLATAVVWGAERFHTNNRRDFGPHVTEVEVVHPDSLVE
jgi:predicted nucleic acid-binding protein